ncbi:MAG: protease inhibitor I42 family protein [Spirochaetota bacterium]
MKISNIVPGAGIVLIVVIVICVSMSACKKDICTIYVNSETDIQTVSVKTGKPVRICLPVQLSTGFSWIVDKKSDNITLLGDFEIQEKKQGKEVTGYPENQIFTIKAISSGKGFVEFLYTEQWRKKEQNDRLVRINIIAE